MSGHRKCVVWDLDNTLWTGVLLEDERVTLRDGVREAIEQLDKRGVLHSIASRNDPDLAWSKLRELRLDHFFLYPQIGWNDKSSAIREIVSSMNVAESSLVFVDDDPFEREEVASSLPEVLCLDASEAPWLADRAELWGGAMTEDAYRRRERYQAEIERRKAEAASEDPREAFLKGLGLRLRITRASRGDLARAEELTQRTSQLNTTGISLSEDQLGRLSESPLHELWVASLEDRFGDYGTIGLVLLDTPSGCWRIRLFLLSCRVMNRGITEALLAWLTRRAAGAGVRLQADFVFTTRNRAMYVAYKFAGFRQVEGDKSKAVLEYARSAPLASPDHVEFLPGSDIG